MKKNPENTFIHTELPESSAGFSSMGLQIDPYPTELCYKLSTPFHINVMYNTCGTPGVFDKILFLSPMGIDIFSTPPGETTPTPRHRHAYFELMIVLKGTVIQELEGNEYLYTAGFCSLMNRNIVHTERTTEECTVLFLGLSDAFVQKLIDHTASAFFPDHIEFTTNSIFRFMQENLQVNEGKAYLDFTPVYQRAYHKTAQNSEYEKQPGQRTTIRLHEITDALINQIFFPTLGVDFSVMSLIYELFDYLNDPAAFHLLPVTVQTKNETLLFYRIRQLMQDTDGRLSRSQLEQALHYSGAYLNTILKQHTGMTISEFGMSLSLEKAARLLTETDLSVNRILEDLHFTNQGFFTRAFKEKYGMTPGAYRKANR